MMNALSSAVSEDYFAAGLGVAVAVLLVGGSALLRWQKNKLRFELLRAAIEQGETRFPAGPPFWLVSLRDGLMILTVGAGLVLVGGLAVVTGRNVPMPTEAEMQETRPRADQPRPAPADQRNHPAQGQGADNGRGRPESGPGSEYDRLHPKQGQGLDDAQGPPGQPPRYDGAPEDQQGGPRRPFPPPGAPGTPGTPGAEGYHRSQLDRDDAAQRPPHQSPAMERWHRAELRLTIGEAAIATGIILLLLGAARIGFSRVERQYAPPPGENPDAPI
jgi:hypothetical protein